MPLVSVIIPTRDRATRLRAAIASAFAAGTDLEVIVVDDASSDETRRVVGEFPAARILGLDVSVGPAGARNAGVAISRGEYLAFLDDDDVRLPGSIDRLLARLQSQPTAAFAYGQAIMGLAEDNHPTTEVRPVRASEGDVFWELLEQNFIYLPSTLVRKSLLLAVGGFPADLTGVEDWYLWLSLAASHPVVAVSEVVAIYRNANAASAQITSDGAAMGAVSDRARERALAFPRVLEAPRREPEALARFWRNHRSDKLIWKAAHLLASDDARTACASLLAALKLNPRRAARPWTFKLLLSSCVRSMERRRARV